LNITNDAVFEDSETFFVNLSDAVGATISDAQGVGTILDNDVQEFPGGLAYTIAGKGNTGAFLYSIDLESGLATELGPVVALGEAKLVFTGLALSPTTDTLFGFGEQGNKQYIVEVNPVNGQVLNTINVSSILTGSSNTAATFDTAGNYHLLQDGVIYKLVGGVLTELFSVDNNDIDGFAIDPATGDMYFAADIGSNSELLYLAVGDIPVSGTASLTTIGTIYGDLPGGTTGAASIDSLAFDNYGSLWGADNDGTLIKIDPSDASVVGGTTLANNEVTGSGVYSLAIGITEDQTFEGGSGNDTITGGSGSDILTGNGGDDLFVWTSSDDIDLYVNNDVNVPSDGVARDVVTDFRDDGPADGDSLELSELLIDEESGDITDYITVEEVGADIVLSISVDGSGDVTQTITLEDTTTAQLGIDAYDLGTAQGQVDALNTLIGNGSIQVDS
jgi:hypothetical protein